MLWCRLGWLIRIMYQSSLSWLGDYCVTTQGCSPLPLGVIWDSSPIGASWWIKTPEFQRVNSQQEGCNKARECKRTRKGWVCFCNKPSLEFKSLYADLLASSVRVYLSTLLQWGLNSQYANFGWHIPTMGNGIPRAVNV